MNCLTLTSRCWEFTAFFGVVFQWENATKFVFLCEKWRTTFPTHCYSYQPQTCCIGLQQFSGTLYWGIKTYEVKSDLPEMVHARRELCSTWRKGIHFELYIPLLVQHSSPHPAVPLCRPFKQLLCWAPWNEGICWCVCSSPEGAEHGVHSVQLAEKKQLISLFYVNMFLL